MPPDEHPQVVALARDVERTGRRVAAVETLMRQLAADMTALATLTTPPAGGSAVRSWLLADDTGEARTDLAALVEWLGAVYLRFPDGALPSCWLWHAHVVEELQWLRGTHGEAYGPDGSWSRVGDWHDRHRPGVVKRLSAVLGCELAIHGDTATASRTVPLGEHTDETAEQWTATRTAPQPTAEQLRAAQTYDAQQHRLHRSA